MTCPLCQTLALPSNPLFIVRLSESSVILGENQGCPGWCVLILNEHAEHLADLPLQRQTRLFEDVARVAAAIRATFPQSAPLRINYECLGNQVGHIHWHVIPRHASDPSPRTAVWTLTPDQLRSDLPQPDREALARRIRAHMESP